MMRVVLYLAVVTALAFGAVWLADRPGDVLITWQGQRIETSVGFLVLTVAAIAFLAVVLWGIVRAILGSPDALSAYLRRRRGLRGYSALSQGLIAVGSGDLRAARKFADEASRIAPAEPLTLLLGAQAAQLAGDHATAERAFEQMAGREDTKLLGLHGLFIEAQRRSDGRAALVYAEEAAKHASAHAGAVPAWAGQAVLEFRSTAGDWSGALERLERNVKSGLIDKTAYRRQRAVLLTAQALAAEDAEPARARTLALEAVRMAPTLIPAAALAGRLLGQAGEPRKAARVIEAAWQANPHPDLAEAYAHLRPGDSARERLKRMETLAARSPGNVEAALALARAALDAREFAIARQALTPLTVTPTRRVAALMAELEELQGDEGRAREWMTRALHARRDPAWTADGYVCDHWLPVSPVTGRLDAFEWKDPLAGEQPGTMIEVHQEARSADRAAAVSTDVALVDAATAPTSAHQELEEPVKSDGSAYADPAAAAREAPRTAKPDGPGQALGHGARDTSAAATNEVRQPPGPVPIAPAVIPLVHAPDDPGPNGAEPSMEPASWSRIKQLFKP